MIASTENDSSKMATVTHSRGWQKEVEKGMLKMIKEIGYVQNHSY